MKKVLFTIASLYDGGAERALSNIVTHFPEDWEIDILLNNERMIEYTKGIFCLSRCRTLETGKRYSIS